MIVLIVFNVLIVFRVYLVFNKLSKNKKKIKVDKLNIYLLFIS